MRTINLSPTQYSLLQAHFMWICIPPNISLEHFLGQNISITWTDNFFYPKCRKLQKKSQRHFFRSYRFSFWKNFLISQRKICVSSIYRKNPFFFRFDYRFLCVIWHWENVTLKFSPNFFIWISYWKFLRYLKSSYRKNFDVFHLSN